MFGCIPLAVGRCFAARANHGALRPGLWDRALLQTCPI
ncbi:MAG: hypothetical protein QOD62_3195 [Actinomycetota bacterium]|nr:hypothetical protein [Actinomycetota bacterium]